MSTASIKTTPANPAPVSLVHLFGIFLRLGCLSFGGPVAHLGYFRSEFVARRGWLSEAAYADLVALCQFLPGPASSQVGASVGYLRGGVPGLVAAWLGFTLPSALLMMLFAASVTHFTSLTGGGWLHGLKLVAVAVVAQALWGMGRTLCPDKERATMAVVAVVIASMLPGVWGQLVAIALGGLGGGLFLNVRSKDTAAASTPAARQSCTLPIEQAQPGSAATPAASLRASHHGKHLRSAICLSIYAALLLLLPFTAGDPGAITDLFARFYRAGALVFGGGHVVLPLLQAAVVPAGLMTNDAFLAGYGAAQALPGPLFTLAAYLGYGASTSITGIGGGLVALVAIFLPGLLLILAVLPYWQLVRSNARAQAAMQGVNAAVVGILLAAFYQPVFNSSVLNLTDFAVALGAFTLLTFWRWPPWLVVVAGAALGIALPH